MSAHGRKTALKLEKKARSVRELSVTKGEQVTIIKEVNEKWIECESKGRTGIVPRTYVELSTNAFRVSFELF